jgi:hypothetical protein
MSSEPLAEWPLCLPCWRQGVSMHADPPREPGWPEEHCSLCGRRTNNGIYVDEATARDAAVLLVRAGLLPPVTEPKRHPADSRYKQAQ